MKNKIIVGQTVIIMILLGVLGMLLYQNTMKNNVEYSYLEYGDDFSEIEMYDETGKIVDLPFGDGSKAATAVLYLTAECSGCIETISDFNRFKSVFGEEVDFIFLWEDDIPRNLIKKYGIDAISYTLKGKTKLSTSTPTFYLIDSNKKIVFKDVDQSNLIQKLIEVDFIEKEVLQEKATQYIVNAYFESDRENRLKLVYFYMPGCSDCMAVNEFIKEEKLDEKYQIVYIYKYNSTQEGVVIDKNKLFANVYGVNWYPSFILISDSGYEIVGKTSEEEVKMILKDYGT